MNFEFDFAIIKYCFCFINQLFFLKKIISIFFFEVRAAENKNSVRPQTPQVHFLSFDFNFVYSKQQAHLHTMLLLIVLALFATGATANADALATLLGAACGGATACANSVANAMTATCGSNSTCIVRELRLAGAALGGSLATQIGRVTASFFLLFSLLTFSKSLLFAAFCSLFVSLQT